MRYLSCPQLVVTVAVTTTEDSSSTGQNDILSLIPISARRTARQLLQAPIVTSNTRHTLRKTLLVLMVDWLGVKYTYLKYHSYGKF